HFAGLLEGGHDPGRLLERDQAAGIRDVIELAAERLIAGGLATPEHLVHGTVDFIGSNPTVLTRIPGGALENIRRLTGDERHQHEIRGGDATHAGTVADTLALIDGPRR